MVDQCIFCKIANGAISSHILYEDQKFIAILDKFPSSPGHTLIIPKTHVENIYTLPTADCTALFPLAQKIALALQETLSCEGLNILQNNGSIAGQTIFHFHLHLIPRFKDDAVHIAWKSSECQDDILIPIKETLQNKLSQ